MATIQPFRGIRYNQTKVKMDAVVAPPYDVITPSEQTSYYDQNPFNIIRLILGREEDRYSAAAETFDKWQDSQVLMRDELPAIYPLVQTFTTTTGATVQRKGFIALCHLEEFEKGIVLPHEKTLSKAKEDRFKLFKATNSNFSQIFGLYSDPAKDVDAFIAPVHKDVPVIDVTFQDVRNELWMITDESVIGNIARLIEPKQILIADGHHRYETALAYRDLRRSQNPNHTGRELYNFVMMFFTNLDDEGLVIFPTHRVIHSLPSYNEAALLETLRTHFALGTYPSHEAMTSALASMTQYAYGIITKDAFIVASLKDPKHVNELVPGSVPAEVKDLDVVLLHTYILGRLLNISIEAQEKKLNIHYLQNIGECAQEVASGVSQIAFIVNATKIDQVRAVAKAGHTMPQKSTFFYPKLISGLVLNKMA
ncbi:MAG TPA: DUF1015 domain-containing protein [Bacteroidota bacterium]|nr:DUF1015 domain-containing protein [Bacteroidota bacterium]